MRLKLTLTVTAIGSLLFGIAFLLFPDNVASLYGVTIDQSNQYPRFFGSALIGFGTVLWLARKISSGPALRAIIFGSFIASLTGIIVSIFQAIDRTGNSLEWSTVAIYLLLTIGFGDFIFRTSPSD
jgi:FtsH-binding integral membrane protein